METSEILVHVSAPSTAADDARYRAQVQAILGFRPVSSQVITLKSDESPCDQTQEQDQSQDQDQNESHDRPHADDARHRGADAHSAGPSLPYTSESTFDLDLHVIPPHNHNIIPSTALAAATDPPPPGGAAPDSLGSPVSVIPDSQPERLVSDNAADLTSGQHQRISSPDCSSPRPSKRCRIDPDPTPGQPSKDVSRKEPTPTATEHEGKEEQKQEPKEKDTTTPQIDRETRPPPDPPSSPIPKSKPKSPNKDKGDNKPSLPPVPVIDIKIVPPMQIRPSPPPISNKKFTTHITPTLSMLFNRLHSPRIYTPAHQSRSLDILERGYWYIRIDILHADADASKPNPNPNVWNPSLFRRFWSFLSEFVGKEERAGWGVWCLLEDVSSSSDTDSGSGSETRSRSQTDSSSSSQHNQSVPPAHELSLKVYAWGEIAVHVYLLLFLASERRIRKMGAQWHDGSEEIVIRMPGSTSTPAPAK
ncbi:hypothetical protein P170DRAFT_436035 [Aspergillus steynii IBT 23096]|uniref:Acetamidase n=1 Tax=Aspergillus steynii IBT 23096 TaxID=1392250 RepID=A0A2I2GDI5_9EURO|nr:uncharacterized protein P170DRAFT_436035 [Aspergillus steynii IBT 23096]PLB50959.1 hypothetical protein P170DRAFT_436035 [Aspergillus steynii IBT 23096]